MPANLKSASRIPSNTYLLSQKGNQTMVEYLQGIKVVQDELSIIEHPLYDTNLVIHSLNCLSNNYCEISTALSIRKIPSTLLNSMKNLWTLTSSCIDMNQLAMTLSYQQQTQLSIIKNTTNLSPLHIPNHLHHTLSTKQ